MRRRRDKKKGSDRVFSRSRGSPSDYPPHDLSKRGESLPYPPTLFSGNDQYRYFLPQPRTVDHPPTLLPLFPRYIWVGHTGGLLHTPPLGEPNGYLTTTPVTPVSPYQQYLPYPYLISPTLLLPMTFRRTPVQHLPPTAQPPPT
eukprot:755463-Hanusia_phi.AAC.1